MTEINVECQDGKVRHPEPFDNLAAADVWANWGHCCLAPHTYVVVTRTTEPISPPAFVLNPAARQNPPTNLAGLPAGNTANRTE